MDEDKLILLQKQVRDNSEDLQKECLDLKNWEQEMKRKEEKLINSGENIKVLPPIRNKRKKIIETSPPVPSTSKAFSPNRIKSYDYNAWDKFDVDAACRKVDDEYDSDESTENVEENAQKKHSEALKFKDEGNSFVKQKLYDSAINSYSEAIKHFPYDEAFYANRALCHLKLDNPHSAESDCTAALQLNDSYVKAYHRRATARISLKDYEGTMKDIKSVLSLEPANKEAKLMLSKVTQILNKSKPLVTSELSNNDMDKKNISQQFSSTNKIKEQIEIHKRQMEEAKKLKESLQSTRMKITEISSDSEQQLLESPEPEKNKETTKLKITEISNESGKELFKEKLPDWLPKVDENYGIVKPVILPAHQRSKKLMKRIEIENVDFENDILPKPYFENNIKVNEKQTLVEEQETIDKKEQIDKIKMPPKILNKPVQEKTLENTEEPKTRKIVEIKIPKIIEIIENKSKKADTCVHKSSKESDQNIKKQLVKESLSSSEKVPEAPKSSVQFMMDWRKNKSLGFRYSYLKQISPHTMPTLFKESMESSVFEDILSVLKEEFTSKERNIFQYLEELSNIKRFRTLIMFAERRTKEDLKDLLVHCKKVEGRSEQEIDKLRRTYEL